MLVTLVNIPCLHNHHHFRTKVLQWIYGSVRKAIKGVITLSEPAVFFAAFLFPTPMSESHGCQLDYH